MPLISLFAGQPVPYPARLEPFVYGVERIRTQGDLETAERLVADLTFLAPLTSARDTPFTNRFRFRGSH